MKRFLMTSVLAAFALAHSTGCKDDSGTGGTAPTPTDYRAPATPAAPASQPEGDHANAVPIGSVVVGGLTLAATQDEPVVAGGEGAFDLKITGYPAGGKPKAVRFWVGAESGEGSVKALAAEETPDNWHTHVEVPAPIPTGSKFWAEVEPATGEKFNVSYELKMN